MSLKEQFSDTEQLYKSRVVVLKKWKINPFLITSMIVALVVYGVYSGYIKAHRKAIKNKISALSVKSSEKLNDIPFAEDIGLVKNIRRINIAHIHAPYNASMVEYKDGYLLLFRYDVLGKYQIRNQEVPFRSFLGCVELDKFFRQKKTPIILNTNSFYSEDPRVFKVGDKVFLSYNDLADNAIYGRTIRLAELDPEAGTVKNSLELDLNIQPIEKNWVPFEYIDPNGDAKVYFSYSINPHKVLRIEDSAKNEVTQLIHPHKDVYQKLLWAEKWGTLRGGTPARLVDGQYLAFFHSSYREKASNKVYYIMGAYTFEAKPPFKITSISKFPIIFKNLYDTSHLNSANKNLRCIFPAGFVVEHKKDKDLIHISCGENDSGVKIITLDKESLYQTLEPLNAEPVFPQMLNAKKTVELQGF